jgi:hypothetical protein
MAEQINYELLNDNIDLGIFLHVMLGALTISSSCGYHHKTF